MADVLVANERTKGKELMTKATESILFSKIEVYGYQPISVRQNTVETVGVIDPANSENSIDWIDFLLKTVEEGHVDLVLLKLSPALEEDLLEGHYQIISVR